MAHGLKARKSKHKCIICWQVLKGDVPAMKFHNQDYHVVCWEKEFKQEHKARSLKAHGKRSI